MTPKTAVLRWMVGVALALCPAAVVAQDDLLLPDLVVRRSDLFDHFVTTGIEPGRTHLRLSNATANIGRGAFQVQGGPAREGHDGEEAETIIQRVFREDGTHVDLPSGSFVHHDGHHHIHVADWAAYRLREALPDGGVGPVVRASEKTSFCIVDLELHDPSLPGVPATPQFLHCASVIQGLSVGWLDIYDKSIEGQWIDITGVEPGSYWLESAVDPEDHFLELDETNNAARIPITLSETEASDAYEPNDALGDLDERREGGFRSPNLGPVGPRTEISDLSIHVPEDVDVFRFYMNSTGGPDDHLRIDFSHRSGDLDLELLHASGLRLARSGTARSAEVIPLTGLPKGWYHALVAGRDGSTNRYTLTLDPPQNLPPRIEVRAPGPGNAVLPRGLGLFTVEWSITDPEDDVTWVTVYIAPERRFHRARLLPASRLTRGSAGFHVINSADVVPGTYWVYCQVTDGGRMTGAWSPGTVTFFEVPEGCEVLPGGTGDAAPEDCDRNGLRDACDLAVGLAADCNENGVPDACDLRAGVLRDVDGDGNADCGPRFHRGDPNGDGTADVSDVLTVLAHLFASGGAPSCLESADVNDDGAVDVSDGISLLGFLFQGAAPPAPPGPPGAACGFDPDAPGSPRHLGCSTYDPCG